MFTNLKNGKLLKFLGIAWIIGGYSVFFLTIAYQRGSDNYPMAAVLVLLGVITFVKGRKMQKKFVENDLKSKNECEYKREKNLKEDYERIVICESCGARNVVKAKVGKCEYCGSAIQ